MRHGQTDYNVAGLCNDDPSRPVRLTEAGVREVDQAAAQLSDVPIERIVVSELPRTRESADIVNRRHLAPITVHPGINDVRTGCEGKPLEVYHHAIQHDPMRARVNGGESLADHRRRVLDFLEWLKMQQEEVVLVVAHEETLRVVVAYFSALSDEEMLRLHFRNGEFVVFDL